MKRFSLLAVLMAASLSCTACDAVDNIQQIRDSANGNSSGKQEEVNFTLNETPDYYDDSVDMTEPIYAEDSTSTDLDNTEATTNVNDEVLNDLLGEVEPVGDSLAESTTDATSTDSDTSTTNTDTEENPNSGSDKEMEALLGLIEESEGTAEEETTEAPEPSVEDTSVNTEETTSEPDNRTPNTGIFSR